MFVGYSGVARCSRSLSPALAQSVSQARYHSYVPEAKVMVNKKSALADESIQIWIEGLQPLQKVTLYASTVLPNTTTFESISQFVADDNGIVSLDRDMSHGGSYTGVEPMGPFSFMEPSPVNKRKFGRFMIKDPTKPFGIDFRVLDSFVDALSTNELRSLHQTSPNLTIKRFYMAAGVEEHSVQEGKVRGTLYLPNGTGPFPGVLSMSGGYPGAMKYKAALLASHGFAALALKYFGEDGLPEDIYDTDLDYFEEAATFVKNHPQVAGENGIGIIANCYGATAGLGLASLGPKGLIRSVAAVNGWCYNIGNFTYKGKPFLTSIKPNSSFQDKSDGTVEWKHSLPPDMNVRAPEDFAEDSSFPFHKLRETAYIFVAGGDDGYFATGEITKFLRNLLQASEHPNHDVLFYPGAGHLIEHSYYPFCDVVRTFGEFHYVGGQQPHHSKAQIDSWPKILDFTRRNLLMTK